MISDVVMLTDVSPLRKQKTPAKDVFVDWTKFRINNDRGKTIDSKGKRWQNI